MPQKLKGVNKVVKRAPDGTIIATYHYWRATGIRIEGEPGTVEFERSLKAAQNPPKAPPSAPAGFALLADEFEKSWEFTRGVYKTRHQREVILKAARERFHWVRITDLNRRSIRDEFMKWRDEMLDTPRKADAYMKCMSRLLSWAYDRGKIEYNHGQKIEQMTGSRNSRRDKIWTVPFEGALLASASRQIRELYLFALFTAARQSDLAGMRWTSFDGKWLVYTPSKTSFTTKVEVHLPVHELPPLRDLMEDLSRCTEFILTTDRPHPWSVVNIIKRFSDAKVAAGLANEDLTFHDIRGTTVSRLYEAGCTDAEVASITGHAIGESSKLGDYAKRSRILAINAFRKWSAGMGQLDNVTLLPHLQTNLQLSATANLKR